MDFLDPMAPVAALTRHGDYDQPPHVPSAHLPWPLTERGRAQAAELATELSRIAAEQGWQIHPTLFCSSLLRAHETASIAAARLSEALGRPIDVAQTDALAERGLGAAANLRLAEIEEALRRDPRHRVPEEGWKADSDYRLPFIGAESLREAGERVARFLRQSLQDVGTRPEGATVVVFVGHGAAFRHAAATLGALPWERVPALSMHHARPVYLQRRAPGHFVHVAGEWKLRATREMD